MLNEERRQKGDGEGKGGDFKVDVEWETPAEIRGNAKAAAAEVEEWMGHKHPAKPTKAGQELSQHSGIEKQAHKHKRKPVLNLQDS